MSVNDPKRTVSWELVAVVGVLLVFALLFVPVFKCPLVGTDPVDMGYYHDPERLSDTKCPFCAGRKRVNFLERWKVWNWSRHRGDRLPLIEW